MSVEAVYSAPLIGRNSSPARVWSRKEFLTSEKRLHEQRTCCKLSESAASRVLSASGRRGTPETESKTLGDLLRLAGPEKKTLKNQPSEERGMCMCVFGAILIAFPLSETRKSFPNGLIGSHRVACSGKARHGPAAALILRHRASVTRCGWEARTDERVEYKSLTSRDRYLAVANTRQILRTRWHAATPAT